MSKIKVLFADHTPFVGGAQLRLAEDISFLDKKKFESAIVTDKDSAFNELYQITDVPVYKIAFPKLKLVSPVALTRLISSVREFQRLVLKTTPHVVMANTTRTLVIAGLAKKLFGLKFKLVSYIRDYDYPKWIFKLINREINSCLFVSKSVQNFYGLPGEVIYLGSDIETKLQNISEKKIEDARKKLQLKKDDFVIGFVGRLVDWKGPLFLLKSIKELKNKNIKIVFWGSGKGQEGSIEEQLKTFAKKNQLEDITVFAGHTKEPEIAYKLMNCFILASIKPEPFSTTIIEAAFSKTPVIATNVGGTVEFIRDGDNGLLVSPNDTNQLTQALLRLIKDSSAARKMAEQAYQDANEFREKVFIHKLEKYLTI